MKDFLKTNFGEKRKQATKKAFKITQHAKKVCFLQLVLCVLAISWC